jgi:hypothetical protein
MSSIKKLGTLTVDALNVSRVFMSKDTVTQLTSITTGVTLNKNSGFVSTVSSTLAANLFTTFTVTNSFVQSGSIVQCNIVNYTGTTGLPSVRVNAIANGSFDIVLSNNHSTAVLNGVVKVAFNCC